MKRSKKKHDNHFCNPTSQKREGVASSKREGSVAMPKKRVIPQSTQIATSSGRATRHRSLLLFSGLFLLVSAVSIIGWLEWRRYEMRQAVQDAVRSAKYGRFSDGEPILRRALARDSGNVELLRPLALGLINSQKLDEADVILTHWCDVRQADAEPYRLRMDLRHIRAMQFKPGDEQERHKGLALADGQRAIGLEPDDEVTAQKVVWLCFASGRFDEANRICRSHLERKPEDPELLHLQARICHSRGDSDEAMLVLEKLLSHRSNFTPGLLLLAILHYEADEPDKAIPLLRKLVALKDGFPKEARYHLSLALARAGHTDEARRVMAEVQLINFEKDTARPGETDSMAVRVRRAELLFGCGRADEAIASLQAVLIDDRKHFDAHRILAAYYDQNGESVKSAEHRRRSKRDGATE